MTEHCPIARGLACAGDRWSMLILRDVQRGMTRFDQLRANLGVAPNILSGRLASLTAEGLLEKRQYNARPPRQEYVLTEAGLDFIPILTAIAGWGYKHRGEGPISRLVDEATGDAVQPLVIDAANGAPIGSRPLRLIQPD